MVIKLISGHTSRFLCTYYILRMLTNLRDLVHSADPDEIDHLEAYLNQQIPAKGDDKTSL